MKHIAGQEVRHRTYVLSQNTWQEVQHHAYILSHNQPHLRPEDVVEEIPHKSPTLLPSWECLRQQVGLILMRIHIGSAPLTSSNTLSYKVIGNTLRLLLQSRIRPRRVR